jgi:signal transduction histidine kinase
MYKGIGSRWIKNYLLPILVILLLVELLFAMGIRSYYFNAAEQNLKNKAAVLSGFLNKYIVQNYQSYNSDTAQLIQDFGKEEVFEIQIIDLQGHVVMSSSGILPVEAVQTGDYRAALQGKESTWIGWDKTSTEKQMAISVNLLDWSGKTKGVIRLVTSLTIIESSLKSILIISAAAVSVIVGIVLLSGLYFIRSIINPVKEINSIAKEMVKGDYKGRIQKKYQDEIGELSDTINHMSEEMGKAEKAKNDFISSISHEIRTPLTSIKGWSETILSVHLQNKEEAERGLEIIVRETGRLTRLVDELLDFSRMESASLTLQAERLDVLNILEDIFFMYSQKARAEGICMEYEFEDGIPELTGDRNRLKQVFINILDNAVKFTGEGGSIKAKIRHCGENILVEIVDSGSGILQEELHRVKEKFYKGSSQKRGSGIGLAVSNEIIKAHGGRLEIHSVLGVGTTVAISLPVKR